MAATSIQMEAQNRTSGGRQIKLAIVIFVLRVSVCVKSFVYIPTQDVKLARWSPAEADRLLWDSD